MSILTYLFFAATALAYFGLAMLTASKPSLAGDSAMGYGLGLAFLGFCFTVCSLALTITMLAKGSFHWVSNNSGTRTLIIVASWLFIALTTFFCAAFKWEFPKDNNPYPAFLHWLAVNHGQIWIPFLWLGACFISLNSGLQVTLPPNTLKILFWSGFITSTIYSAGLAFGYLSDSAQRFEAQQASQKADDDKWHQQVLDDIAAHKPTDPIVNLLAQTTQVRPEDSRAAALAKVKEHPNWENEIVAVLDNKDRYTEVYYFLDGNKVEHPEKFVEPLNRSILWLADKIRADIKDSNNLQDWSFSMYHIDNLLRGIDSQSWGKDVDFSPAFTKLAQALKTTPPERFKDVRYPETGLIEGWLRKHKK